MHKDVNTLEKQQCEGLESYIENYEEENGIEVTKAKFFKFSNMKRYGFFDGMSNYSVLAYDGAACTWSSIGTINFYTNRNFEKCQLTIQGNEEIWKEYILLRGEGFEKNFVCIGDTLYYLAYI